VSADSTTLVLYGATGVLGREILVALEGACLDGIEVLAVAGPRTSGEEIPWPGGALRAHAPEAIDLASADLAIFATPASVSEALAPVLREKGALIIDCSGAVHEGSTTLGPGFDADALSDLEGHITVANPAAAALEPLARAVARVTGIASITATVIVGASMSGRDGEAALGAQTVALLSHGIPDPGPLGGVLAFNLLPGGPGEHESAGGLGAATARELPALVPDLGGAKLRVQVVSAPVFSGVALSVTLATEDGNVDRDAVLASIDSAPGLLRSTEGRPALRDALDLEGSLVGALRWDEDDTLMCWVVSDALQRTASTVAKVVGTVIEGELW
jgi:aspartate-semialdehyde dehydrogenase